MVREILVRPDIIELGDRILQRLDAAKFPISVALWILNEDEFGEWRFLIGTPVYDREGPLIAFRRLRAALEPDDVGILLKVHVSVQGNRNPLIKGLRARFKNKPDVNGMRLGGHSIGDFWIDDAYVYRIR